MVTDDRSTALEAVAGRFGQPPEHIAGSSLFIICSLAHVGEEFQQLHDDYGFGYVAFTGGSETALAPVAEQLSAA